MAVTKINGFNAPYRSQTFQGQARRIVGASGLMQMDGSISNSGGNIVVPPFEFIQNGLIVSVDAQKLIPDPEKPAPYFLAVSAATTNPVDDLSFQTPESPSDISSEQVLIGMWDGVEWRKPQLLSIREVYKDIDQANIDFGRVGPVTGLLTSWSSPNYTISPGIIVDRQGLRQGLTLQDTFPSIPKDSDFDRVDRIVYRRPIDSENRIGMRQYVLGGSYAAAFTKLYDTTVSLGSNVHQRVRALVASDNTVHTLLARGYGIAFQLVYAKYSSSRTVELVAPTTVLSMDTNRFSACIDKDGNIQVTYTNNGDLYWAKLSDAGAILVSPQLVHHHATANVVGSDCVYDAELDRLFVVTELAFSATDHRTFFQSLQNASVLSIAVPPTQLTIASGYTTNQSITITEDKDIYIAVEEALLHRIFLAKFSDNGVAVGSPILLSTSTEWVGHSTLTSAHAKKPKVRVSNNKSIFVTFLQNKGTEYGVTVWNDGTAKMVDLFSASENFKEYDVYLDDFLNAVHILAADNTSVRYAKLENWTTRLSGTLAATSASSAAIVKDKYGSLFHLWADPQSGTYSNYGLVTPIVAGGAGMVVIGSDSHIINAQQFLVKESDVSPKVGDQIITSGLSAGNNITSVITYLTTVSLNGTTYWVVTISGVFLTFFTNDGTVNFNNPDGNSVRFTKTNADLTSLAFRFDVLETDMLLARISLPGPIILNYTDSGVGPTPAPTSRLIPYGHGVTVDWGFTTLGALKLTGSLRILDLVNNYNYTVADGEYPIADGEALYAVLDLSSPTVTPLVTSSATLDWAQPIQVLGVNKGGYFIPHALLTSLDLEEMEPGEVASIGHDLPDMIRQRLGIVSDTQYEAYDNHYNILPEDSYPQAISKLDASVYAIQNDFNELETNALTSPATMYTSTGMVWEGDNTKLDILVFVNGKFQVQDTTGTSLKEYKKFDTNKLQFTYTIPSGAEITIFKVRSGGGASGFLVVKDEGTQIAPICQKLNFTGPGVVAANGGSGQVNVYVPGGPAQSLRFVKSYRNGEAGVIPSGSAVAFDLNGNIVLADSNVSSLSDFVGVTNQDIDPGNYGEVVKLGDASGVLAGLGAIPGDLIYLGEVPGSLVLVPPPLLTDTIIIVGRAEPENATFPDGTATALYVNPQLVSAGA